MTPASLLVLAGLLLAQTPTVKGLEPFRSEAGGFSVLLPGKPNTTTMQNKSPAGEVDINVFTVSKDGLTVGIFYSDHPIDTASPIATQFLDGVVSGLVGKNKLIKQEDLKFEGGLARLVEWEVKFFFASDPYLARARIYLKNGRLFQVFVQGPAQKSNSEMSREIFDSFKITDFKPAFRKPTSPAPSDGKPFVAKESKFEVVLPTTPELVSQEFPVGDVKFLLKTYRCVKGTGFYGIVASAYPESARRSKAASLLVSVQEGVVGKGKVTEQAASAVGGVPVRNFRWEAAAVEGQSARVGRGRLYLKDLQLYQVLVIGTADDCNSATANRMFDSFKILDK